MNGTQSVNEKYSVAELGYTDDDLHHSDYHPRSLDVNGDHIPSVCQHKVHLRMLKPKQTDLDTISSNLGLVRCLRIQQTLDNTAQFARLDTRILLRNHFKAASQLPESAALMTSLPTHIFGHSSPLQCLLGTWWNKHVSNSMCMFQTSLCCPPNAAYYLVATFNLK
jgi:hypothetical protein